MSRILLLANINCDHVLSLSDPLVVGTWIRVAARPASVVDTTGAGDAFTGGLIHGLARGMAIQDALQCAVDRGAFAVASESSIPSSVLKNWLRQPH